MNFEIILIAAVALALSASSSDAQGLNGQSANQADAQITAKASALDGDTTQDVPAAARPVARNETEGQPKSDIHAALSSIDRAGRDATPRTRGAVEVKGQNADGIGNITDHVEVAGGASVAPPTASVSGTGSVVTGNN
jgi:hypothetical protein